MKLQKIRKAMLQTIQFLSWLIILGLPAMSGDKLLTSLFPLPLISLSFHLQTESIYGICDHISLMKLQPSMCCQDPYEKNCSNPQQHIEKQVITLLEKHGHKIDKILTKYDRLKQESYFDRCRSFHVSLEGCLRL